MLNLSSVHDKNMRSERDVNLDEFWKKIVGHSMATGFKALFLLLLFGQKHCPKSGYLL